MGIVSTEYYLDVYLGRDGSNLEVLLKRSEEMIDYASKGAVMRHSQLSEAAEGYLKNAICAQTEFILANGGMDYIDESGSQWATVGHFTTYSQRLSRERTKQIISDRAWMFLESGGLIYCGIMGGGI